MSKPDEDEILALLQAHADAHGEKAAEYVNDAQKRMRLAEISSAKRDRYLKAISVLKELKV